MQLAQRSCNKYNRHTRRKSYLSMKSERNNDENQKRFHSPAVEVTLTQRQSTRASRNVQMRKFIARTTATPQTCLAKLDKQVGNSRNDNGQISTPNRAESISKNRSLDVHISPSSNITTANKRTNVSSKQQQQTAKTKKEPEIIQNQQRDNQDHAALEVELKASATQGVRHPTSVIPITERKIPIPKLERDMLQKVIYVCLFTFSHKFFVYCEVIPLFRPMNGLYDI